MAHFYISPTTPLGGGLDLHDWHDRLQKLTLIVNENDIHALANRPHALECVREMMQAEA